MQEGLDPLQPKAEAPEVEAAHTPASGGPKPLQPYLQRGSGQKRRSAVPRERRYVPKGGHVMDFGSQENSPPNRQLRPHSAPEPSRGRRSPGKPASPPLGARRQPGQRAGRALQPVAGNSVDRELEEFRALEREVRQESGETVTPRPQQGQLPQPPALPAEPPPGPQQPASGGQQQAPAPGSAQPPEAEQAPADEGDEGAGEGPAAGREPPEGLEAKAGPAGRRPGMMWAGKKLFASAAATGGSAADSRLAGTATLWSPATAGRGEDRASPSGAPPLGAAQGEAQPGPSVLDKAEAAMKGALRKGVRFAGAMSPKGSPTGGRTSPTKSRAGRQRWPQGGGRRASESGVLLVDTACGGEESGGEEGRVEATSAFVRELFYSQQAAAKAAVARSQKALAKGPSPAPEGASQGAGPAQDAAAARLQEERVRLGSLRAQLEAGQAQLRSERAAFDTHKAEVEARWAGERGEEERRLKADRAALQRQSRALLRLPTKQERSEVELLGARLEQEKRAGQARDARHRLTVERLRRQVAELQERAKELREEVSWHEQRRLQEWEASERAASQGSGGAQARSTRGPSPAPASRMVDAAAGEHLLPSTGGPGSAQQQGEPAGPSPEEGEEEDPGEEGSTASYLVTHRAGEREAPGRPSTSPALGDACLPGCAVTRRAASATGAAHAPQAELSRAGWQPSPSFPVTALASKPRRVPAHGPPGGVSGPARGGVEHYTPPTVMAELQEQKAAARRERERLQREAAERKLEASRQLEGKKAPSEACSEASEGRTYCALTGPNASDAWQIPAGYHGAQPEAHEEPPPSEAGASTQQAAPGPLPDEDTSYRAQLQTQLDAAASGRPGAAPEPWTEGALRPGQALQPRSRAVSELPPLPNFGRLLPSSAQGPEQGAPAAAQQAQAEAGSSAAGGSYAARAQLATGTGQPGRPQAASTTGRAGGPHAPRGFLPATSAILQALHRGSAGGASNPFEAPGASYSPLRDSLPCTASLAHTPKLVRQAAPGPAPRGEGSQGEGSSQGGHQPRAQVSSHGFEARAQSAAAPAPVWGQPPPGGLQPGPAGVLEGDAGLRSGHSSPTRAASCQALGDRRVEPARGGEGEQGWGGAQQGQGSRPPSRGLDAAPSRDSSRPPSRAGSEVPCSRDSSRPASRAGPERPAARDPAAGGPARGPERGGSLLAAAVGARHVSAAPGMLEHASVPVQEVRYPDGKVDRRFGNGQRTTAFPNGTLKVYHPDGRTVVRFTNGDTKRASPDGRVEYWYSEVGIWHTTHPSGVQVYRFQSGQTEAHFADGSKEIIFPDGAVRAVSPEGAESVAERGALSREILLPRPELEA